jgi:hypothetical protein
VTTSHRLFDGDETPPRRLAQNDTYLGHRMLYNRSDETEAALYDIVEGVQAKKILRRAVVGVLIMLFFSMLTSLSGESGSAFGLVFFASLVWFGIVLFLPYQVVLGDWNLLLDGKAAFAETAYGTVYRTLRQDHDIPADIAVRRLRIGPPVRGVRNMLQVRLHKYSIYVSVFAFGSDLYLGWTLWRRDLPIVLVFRWIGASLRRTMWNTGIAGVREIEPVKAMRDAVHDGLRAGMEAALLGEIIPMEDTFGGTVPIETLPDASLGEDATRWLTVREEVPVYSVDDGLMAGYAQPGSAYQVIRKHDTGVVVKDNSGGLAVLRDMTVVTWS